MSTPSPAKGTPQRVVLNGRYARLEPIGPQHVADLYRAATEPGADGRFTYLFEEAPTSEAEMAAYVQKVMPQDDPMLFTVLDRATGQAEGRQALMRIVPEHGVIEIGSIYWGPRMARSRIATEALYLHARYVFDALGYRRFEWKCNDRNEPSKAAAQRFGFRSEGVFRQHMISEGREPRHSVVRDARQGLAGDQGRVRTLAGAGQFRCRRPAKEPTARRLVDNTDPGDIERAGPHGFGFMAGRLPEGISSIAAHRTAHILDELVGDLAAVHGLDQAAVAADDQPCRAPAGFVGDFGRRVERIEHVACAAIGQSDTDKIAFRPGGVGKQERGSAVDARRRKAPAHGFVGRHSSKAQIGEAAGIIRILDTAQFEIAVTGVGTGTADKQLGAIKGAIADGERRCDGHSGKYQRQQEDRLEGEGALRQSHGQPF